MPPVAEFVCSAFEAKLKAVERSAMHSWLFICNWINKVVWTTFSFVTKIRKTFNTPSVKMSSWESILPDTSVTFAQDTFWVVDVLFFKNKLQLKSVQNKDTWVTKRTSSHEVQNGRNSDKSIEIIYVYLISSPTAKNRMMRFRKA